MISNRASNAVQRVLATHRKGRREVDEAGYFSSGCVYEDLDEMTVAINVSLNDMGEGKGAIVLCEVLEVASAIGRGCACLGLDGSMSSLLGDLGHGCGLVLGRDEAGAECDDLALLVERRVSNGVGDLEAVDLLVDVYMLGGVGFV